MENEISQACTQCKLVVDTSQWKYLFEPCEGFTSELPTVNLEAANPDRAQVIAQTRSLDPTCQGHLNPRSLHAFGYNTLLTVAHAC